MIINGGSRKNGAFFAKHLMRADENERVDVLEIRGLGAETIPDAFREMKAVASGTQCRNYFYHANLNSSEQLTPEQWAEATNMLECTLGLSGQPRFVVEHEKEGRVHRHVVWSRIDADSMKAISDSLTYSKHEQAARQIEAAFGHEAVPSVLVKDRETSRPERNPKDWESFRAADPGGIDPKAMKAELTGLWHQADSGQAFAAALAERGYVLARGDRRVFCVIDAAGDEHSLGRRLDGVKATAIRARMVDIDREGLPSVAEGRELARQRRDETPVSAFDAILAERLREAEAQERIPIQAEMPSPSTGAASAFEVILAKTVREAAFAAQAERDDPAVARFERWRGWWETMRTHVTEWGYQLQEQFGHYFSRGEPETPEPGHTQEMGPER